MRVNNRTKLYGGVIVGMLMVYLGYIHVNKAETYKSCGSCKT